MYKKKEDYAESGGRRYKASLVPSAKKEGVDYNEIFFPVFKYTSIHVLLNLLVYGDLESEQLDVKTAFFCTGR